MEASEVRVVLLFVGSLALVLGLILSVPVGGDGWCDGAAPEWLYEGTACVEAPAPIEYLYPWHWGAREICLGMCAGLEQGDVIE
jgi:hypothetical protein